MTTWTKPRTVLIVSDGSSARVLQPRLLVVEVAEDLDRLAAERAVELVVVGIGQLAGAVVELGVAQLAVLGLARGLELGEVPSPAGSDALEDPTTRRSGAVTNTTTAARITSTIRYSTRASFSDRLADRLAHRRAG